MTFNIHAFSVIGNTPLHLAVMLGRKGIDISKSDLAMLLFKPDVSKTYNELEIN